ncbi:MAG TPA: ABC transporter ATP-binding protein [Verrucomicrobiae bacterium]|jgi:ABC-type multidrug transport system fused ATPase/permease subunit|nr:ABC transporter ATP-binding protein [Verrucomicrobiae bacterium]
MSSISHAHGSHADPTFRSRPRATGEVIRRVGIYLRPYKLMVVGTVGCAVLSLAFGFLYPKLTRVIIDDVIREHRYEWLTPAALGLAGAFLFRELFNGLRILINNSLEQNVIYDMRRDVYARLQRLPVSWFDQRASGDLMTRIIEDVNNVERLLIDGVEQGTVALLSIAGALVFMTLLNRTLTLVALIPVPFLIGGALWYTLTAHKRYRVQREASSAMNALLMDNLQGIRQIKAFGRQTHEDARFAQRADDLREGSLVVMRAWAIYGPAMQFFGAFGVGLVLWIGGIEVIHGKMDVGQLVAFMFYAGMFFYDPIGRLHGLNQILQSARAAAARVFDILDMDEERSDRRGLLQKPVRGDIVYQDVSFSYAQEERRLPAGVQAASPESTLKREPQPERHVLQNISLHATPGEMIALVGPTGAGKSTLVNLLPAFYEATAGKILIDGQDISGISLESLRDNISVVSQEAFLFNGTVRENILYGRLSATEEELIAASRAANCHDFISKLPNGYDSRVGERGVKLSVGEKQRVSIARALLKDAPILVLDEATASVDTATEKLIQEALERLMAHRTSFVIAHRLSTIRNADQILVLRHGQIVERGTHDELLARNGLYAKLARIQGTTFIEEGFEKLEVG